MKNRRILTILGAALALGFGTTATAQMSEECAANISLFAESAKQKNYADALSPWEEAYANCKGSHRSIYTYGVQIVNWQISQAKGEQREQLIDKLFAVYDEQIQYFGNDKKQPKALLLGWKAYYLQTYRPSEVAKRYEWIKECVTSQKHASKAEFLQLFVQTSCEMYKADNSLANQFIDDYLFANEMLEANGANAALKNAATYAQIDQQMDGLFATSGVADCEQMDKIYASQVEASKDNYDFLKSTIELYKSVNCKESNVYFAASENAHRIKPTAESAAGCAAMSYKKGEFARAVEYFNEAASLTDDNEDKADYFNAIAQVYNANLNNPIRSREYARKSLEVYPEQGTPYLLIGILYANAKGIYDSAALNKTVFWVAVDKFVKAKQMDPTLTEKANELIRTYSNYFPTKEEVFFEPDLEPGKAFTVGGWIGETTTCR